MKTFIPIMKYICRQNQLDTAVTNRNRMGSDDVMNTDWGCMTLALKYNFSCYLM